MSHVSVQFPAMSGLTKRVRGASAPSGTDATDVLGGGRTSMQGAPPSADLVARLLSAFTDDVGPGPGGAASEESAR
jgi:hypothetical protein